MSTGTKSYQESLIAALQDPHEAAAYLTAALEDGDSAIFLLALQNVAEAHGMSHLLAGESLNREDPSRMRCGHEQGHFPLSGLVAILDALKLRLAVDVK